MKVKELMETLSRCDPEADVVFHEYLDVGEVIDFEFAPLQYVQPGFAMNAHIEGGDNEITVYVEKGRHAQGYEISHPVVALASQPLVRRKINATTDFWSGRDDDAVKRLEQKRPQSDSF